MKNILLLFFVCACSSKIKSMEEMIPSIPIIPAPHAVNYAVQGNQPKDPMVADIADDWNWSEALSGAAAQIGLEIDRTPLITDARWAAVMAGFPYKVSYMIIGDVEVDEPPVGLPEAISEYNPINLGLARVRKGTKDRWVVLIGEGGYLEESFPRELELGDELNIEGKGTWRLADPTGGITTGELPIKGLISMEGEWWLELSRSGVYSSIPIYAGIGTPVSNLFFSDYVGVDEIQPSEVQESVLILMDEMRQREGLSILRYDKMLVGLAQYPLQYYVEGSWDREVGEKNLRKAGFAGGPAYQFGCTGENVLNCLDQLSWNIDARQALLDPQIRNIGIATYVDTAKVAVMINLSSE
jgi:hypothetical protein